MKAACISNDYGVITSPTHRLSDELVKPFALTVGEAYLIVGMAIVSRVFHFLVQDDTGSPLFAPASNFDVYAASVPPGWSQEIVAGKPFAVKALGSALFVTMWGYPEFIEDSNHIQALLDGDSYALDTFESHLDDEVRPRVTSRPGESVSE